MIINKKRNLFIYSLIFFLFSCQQTDKEPSLLEIKLKFKNLILIDAPGKSCTLQISDPAAESDLGALKGLLGGITLNWSGDQEYEVLYVRVKLLSGSLSNNQEIMTVSGTELGFMLKGSPGRVIIPGGSLSNPTVLSSPTSCNIEIGGIGVKNKASSAYGQGVVTVYGATIRDGQPFPVQTQANFTFQYDGVQ